MTISKTCNSDKLITDIEIFKETIINDFYIRLTYKKQKVLNDLEKNVNQIISLF